MIKLSKMSGKLQGLQGINTNPLENEYCNKMSRVEGSICSQCYSRKMVATYRKSAAKGWSENARELRELIPQAELPRTTHALVRFHAHGELQNPAHLVNFVNIARHNPQSTFALWTKRKDLIAPMLGSLKNLIMVYSNPIVDKPMSETPAGFDKVFNVVTKEYTKKYPDLTINCGQNKCIDCQRCYKRDSVEIINELLK